MDDVKGGGGGGGGAGHQGKQSVDAKEAAAQSEIDDVNDARRVDTIREGESSTLPGHSQGGGLLGRIGKAFGFGSGGK